MKVKGYEDLYKNEMTGMIINKNRTNYFAARDRKKNILNNIENNKAQKNKIDILEKEVEDLKQIVMRLMGQGTEEIKIKKTRGRPKKNIIQVDE